MKKIILTAIMLLSFAVSYATEENLILERAIITDSIEEREPNLPLDEFNLYSKAYYFNDFQNVGDEKTIYHNWYYLEEEGEETLMASIPLKIAGFRWRTWSSKNLYLPGKWKVETVLENNTIASSEIFIVE